MYINTLQLTQFFDIYNDRTTASDKVCSSTLKNVKSTITNSLTHYQGGNACQYLMSCLMTDDGVDTPNEIRIRKRW